jgi:hypothetical protein
MSVSPHDRDRRNARLRAILRAGDPAQDLAPTAVERLRQRTLAASSARWPARFTAWVALAGAAAATVFLAVLWSARPFAAPERSAAIAASGATGGTGGAPPAERVGTQQMQFQTPGGTRIIWMVTASLNP